MKMKNVYLFIACIICLLYSKTAAAYGNDVIISNEPGVTHSEVDIDVAFNGWIYAAYSFVDDNEGGICIRRSKDNGLTWQTLDSYSVQNIRYSTFDITVAGTDTNALALYVSGVNNNLTDNTHTVFMDKYDAQSGIFINAIFIEGGGTRKIYDVAIATDYKFPAVGASPYSVALVYTYDGVSADSVRYVVSTDGGNSVQPVTTVTTSARRMGKVSLAYGKSLSGSNGRYFLAWEEFETPTAKTGHIYTSRNQSAINGVFIPAVNLDSVNTGMINLCRNPRIACSHADVDNDSASVTTVVLVERDYNADGSDFDILGFYNKRSHFTNYWYRLDVHNSSANDMQPDISYDPAAQNFMVTYLDSTGGILPYVINEWNLNAPNAWTTVTAQYNDIASNLRTAFPKVVVNPGNGKAVHAWVQENGSGNGVALFDAEYRQTAVTNLTETTCANAPFSFNGQMLDTSGVYRDTITTAQGDSVVILSLTVNPYETKTVAESICAGNVFAFNGQNLSVPGTYYDTLSASAGCDTIVTLNLTVNIVVTPVINQAGDVLSVQPYNSYQWILNGTDIPLANGQTHTAASNGTYTVEVTDVSGCSATSAPVTVTGVGIGTIQEAGINIYPNPTADVLNIEMTTKGNANLIIADVAGSIVMEKTISGNERINLQHLPQGVYMLQFIQAGRTSSAKITKQ